MAIKNRDGTVYKLREPNPFMETQNAWDYSTVRLINMKGGIKEIIRAKRKKLRFLKDVVPEEDAVSIRGRDFINEINEKPPINELILKNMIEFHCSPAIVEKTVDEFYDDVRIKVSYGYKFIFEAIIVTESDLAIQFWSLKNISPKSIVYPKNGSKRWWEVEKVEEKSGGYLMTGLISAINPDYS